MTKKDFLIELESRVDALVTQPILQQMNEIGDRFYILNIRKVLNNTVSYENITFVVVKEETPDEATYYLNSDAIAFENVHEDKELRAVLMPLIADSPKDKELRAVLMPLIADSPKIREPLPIK